MRVIAGSRKGHGLKAPSGREVRPTEGRVKESLFNILGGVISSDAVVLDAFAGTGSIGIEFLSRGAGKCYFVDNSNESIKFINQNIAHTKFEESSEVNRMDIRSFITRAASENIEFDYIYIDPPFDKIDLIIDTMNCIKENNICNDGLILVEHVEEFEIDEEKFKLVDKRNYGGKHISFYNIIN